MDLYLKKITTFWRSYRFPILLVLGMRLMISFWMALLWYFLDPYFPLIGKNLGETYSTMSPQPTLLGRAFIDVWLRWDAVHYMNIAHQGYEGVGLGDLNFLPLYPYLTRFLTPLFGRSEPLTGLILSTLFTFLAAIVFYQLVLDYFEDEQLARHVILVWMVFPSSFFLLAPFTEATFSFLALVCLWAIHRRKWVLAGLFACLAATARTQGLILIPVLLVAGWQEKIWRFPSRWKFVLGLILAPAGHLLYLVWRTELGGLFWITDSYSQYSGATVMDPFSNLVMELQLAIRSGLPAVWAEALFSILIGGIVIWMLTRQSYRRQPVLMTYSVLTWCFVLMKHNLMASPIQSASRYMISIFPAFIGMAALELNLPERGQKVYVLVNLILMLLMTTLYAMWIFVG